MMGRTLKKSKKPLKTIFFIVSLGLIILGVDQKLKIRKATEVSKQNVQNLSTTPSFEDKTSGWETYFNPEYKFTVKYPRFLYPIETKNSGGYQFFIRFIENDFSQGKGVAMGIRKTTLSSEIEQIKKEIGSDIEATLIKDEKYMVGELSATKLEYEPVDPEQGEVRTIVILNNTYYSFSISTTPEQIDAVVASFSLNPNFKGCQEILSFGSEQPFLQSYCLGEYCSKEKEKEFCEKVDVVKFADKSLFEENGKDGIGDCVWDEVVLPNQCRPRF